MNNLAIKKSSFLAIETDPNFYVLEREAVAEAAIIDGGKFDAVTYQKLDEAGILNSWGAYYNGKLIGFTFIICTVLPKTSVYMTTCDLIFVGKEYRRTGAGLKLIKEARIFGKNKGTKGILFTAKEGGTLDKLLPRLKCEKIQHVYLERF